MCHICPECISWADMRIVASTASMLEEPYWRIEEPNPLMAEQSKATKAERNINEATSLSQPQWGCSMRRPHCGYLNEAASLMLVDCCCLIEAASLWLPHWINLSEQLTEAGWLLLPYLGILTVAASLRLCYCGCFTVALYLNLKPRYQCGLIDCATCLYKLSLSSDSNCLAFCLEQSRFRSYKESKQSEVPFF